MNVILVKINQILMEKFLKLQDVPRTQVHQLCSGTHDPKRSRCGTKREFIISEEYSNAYRYTSIYYRYTEGVRAQVSGIQLVTVILPVTIYLISGTPE